MRSDETTENHRGKVNGISNEGLSEHYGVVMPPAAADAAKWSGRVFLWEDEGLFVGRPGNADMHESPAIKICIALDGEFVLGDELCPSGGPFSGAVIPAGVFHSIRGNGSAMVMILLAPEGKLGRMLGATRELNRIIPMSGPATELRKLMMRDGIWDDNSAVENAIRAVIAGLSEYLGGGAADIDPRIARSIEWIRNSRQQGISVRALAAGFDLSESRFSHLFSENLRVPVRRYLLWLRLRDALHLMNSSQNLTEAAHSAGFADSSHLTRTFRSALGIAPSDLVRHSTIISNLR